MLNSVNAHFKLWDDAVQDSFSDRMVEATPEQVNITPPTCTCSDKALTCGGDTHYPCLPNQKLHQKQCIPLLCDASNQFSCVNDDSCCTIPARGNCWRSSADTPNLAQTPPTGYSVNCSATDRVFTYSCGSNAGQQVCQLDNKGIDKDGDRDCKPVCDLQQIPTAAATFCPGSDVSLTTDTSITFVSNCSQNSSIKCRASCNTGYHLDNTKCVPDQAPPPSCPSMPVFFNGFGSFTWSSFLNANAIWAANANDGHTFTDTATTYETTIHIDNPGTYQMLFQADNSGSALIDEISVCSSSNYSANPTSCSLNLAAGDHTLKLTATNQYDRSLTVAQNNQWGRNPAGVAMTLSDSSNTPILKTQQGNWSVNVSCNNGLTWDCASRTCK